ncbi:hypothetical protein RB195_011008 [Necator americanus]|uniref:Uncharacterized protein n=1 Tax=Necator americanus TaxID=51031 RepID=A0ABR1D0F8_NECAM
MARASDSNDPYPRKKESRESSNYPQKKSGDKRSITSLEFCQAKMDESELDDLKNSSKRLLYECNEETTENGSIFNDALMPLAD